MNAIEAVCSKVWDAARQVGYKKVASACGVTADLVGRMSSVGQRVEELARAQRERAAIPVGTAAHKSAGLEVTSAEGALAKAVSVVSDHDVAKVGATIRHVEGK